MSKTILVTGASRGIGKAILIKFASNGYNLIFNSLNESSLRETHNELQTKFPSTKIYSQVCDMSDKEQVLNFGQKVLQEFPSIDILVNNAGKYVPGNITSVGYEDDLESMIATNLMSAYWIGKSIIPNMMAKKKGHIFTLCSIAGLQAYPNGGSYSISKFALQGYIRTIREELKIHNIKVTGIYPGATHTDSWAGSNLPKDRFIQSEDIADQIFAISQLSDSAVVEDIVIRPQLGDI